MNKENKLDFHRKTDDKFLFAEVRGLWKRMIKHHRRGTRTSHKKAQISQKMEVN